MKRRIFKLPIAFAAMVFLAVPVASAAQDVQQLRDAVQSAEILPRDYRRNINLTAKDGIVSLSVYRDPEAQKNDCKIDSILLTGRIINASPSVRKVRVAFYDLTKSSHYWLCEVAATSVTAYARGALTRDEVIKAVTLSEGADDSLLKTYGGLSYRQMIDQLGSVEGPLQEQRAVALVRINSLHARGVDVGELRKQYLHVEDLARRGDQKSLLVSLAALTKNLDSRTQPGARLSELDALLKSVENGPHVQKNEESSDPGSIQQSLDKEGPTQ